MPDSPPRCPDCGVEMERMTLDAHGYKLRFVSEENKDGILGSIGAKQTFGASTVVCPECGLSRIYADIE